MDPTGHAVGGCSFRSVHEVEEEEVEEDSTWT